MQVIAMSHLVQTTEVPLGWGTRSQAEVDARAEIVLSLPYSKVMCGILLYLSLSCQVAPFKFERNSSGRKQLSFLFNTERQRLTVAGATDTERTSQPKLLGLELNCVALMLGQVSQAFCFNSHQSWNYNSQQLTLVASHFSWMPNHEIFRSTNA